MRMDEMDRYRELIKENIDFVGLIGAACIRAAVYIKAKNAKKYRHGVEYGSAR